MKRSPAVWPVIRFLLTCHLCLFTASTVAAQDGDVTAVVPPLVMGPAGEGDDEPAVDLLDQRITVSLFQDAAFVHLGNLIENPLDDSTDFTVSLSVGGYALTTAGDTLTAASGLLDVDLWNGEESAAAELRESDSTTDETLEVSLAPHATATIEALFWVPTMVPAVPVGGGSDSAVIPPGERVLTILLGGASPDQDVANTSQATVVFADGLSPLDSLVSFDPLPDDQTDSAVTWNWSETDEAPAERIVIRYRTLPGTPSRFDTIEKLSAHARCCALPDLLQPDDDDDR